jgi:3-hydroxyacyl-CoA dehydrogenase/enoyl-CoA hydratase/3-hydroxybutyryl-CoA epimerase
MTHFGFPVGPIALLDEVGIDVAHKASGVMLAAFGERMQPSSAVAELVAGGRLGRKAGKGFYLYHSGHKTEPDPAVYKLLGIAPLASVDPAEVERRLVYSLLNEAALAMAEAMVTSARSTGSGTLRFEGDPCATSTLSERETSFARSKPSSWPMDRALPRRRLWWTWPGMAVAITRIREVGDVCP